jgi:hypothetical protein
MRKIALLAATAAGFLLLSAVSRADTLELKDGTVLNNCYLRDEGIRLLVWRDMSEVGGPALVYPRSQVKTFKIDRDDSWDVKPSKPDLTVTYIELTPKLAGLHGRVDYDQLGRPTLRPGGPIKDIGDRKYLYPEEMVGDLKLKYKEGEEVTLTAHVKNVGFATAKPFEATFLIDGKEVKKVKGKALKEMEEISFPLKWKWQSGKHTAGFRIDTKQPEIATINNEISDPLWGFSYFYVVSKGRVKAWHETRTASGTFCFEDYYRWHVDIMNTLFEASKYPSAPNGVEARVRLDRILYADDVDASVKTLTEADGIGYHQGGWIWTDSEEEKKTGKWAQTNREWRCATEWSLPHELGHQLGLVDYYALDDGGYETHTWPDNGGKVTHFQNHPVTMMHWHGPHLWSELDAGYLNKTWDMPRGHFGDYYFGLPKESAIRITDINGRGIEGAKVELFQRGVRIDKNGPVTSDGTVSYSSVIEDGNFDNSMDTTPTIMGTTGSDGLMKLPNRKVDEVRTLNGYHRTPNPFGNVNVVGARGLMLARVTKAERTTWFWLELTDFLTAVYRGESDRFVLPLKTDWPSIDSPLPPRNVKAEWIDNDHVKLTWDAPAVPNEQHYLELNGGYRVYRRIGDNGLNDRPWFPVATLNPATRECVIDLKQFPEDTYWFTQVNRFGVSSIGALGIESGIVSLMEPKKP